MSQLNSSTYIVRLPRETVEFAVGFKAHGYKNLTEQLTDQRHAQKKLRALLDAPPAKYDDTLLPFLAMMRMELHANAHKGDREGWLSMTTGECLLEIYWHTSKLQRALRDNERDGIREFSADIANLCMMMVDVAGALGVQDPPTPGPLAHQHQPSACSHPHRIAHFDKGEITAEVCQQCGDVQKREQPLSTFTVFCREANNIGTTWIGTVEALDAEHASELGAEQCSVEWGSGGQNWSLDDIAVIGVAEGSVNILKWDDIE